MLTSAIVELRQYTLHRGMRKVLVDLFEQEFLASQELLGMEIMGPFYDLEDDDRFVWFRGFPDMEQRAEMLRRFYDGPVWEAHKTVANSTMIDSDNVLLLRSCPLDQPTEAEKCAGTPPALVVVNLMYMHAQNLETFGSFFNSVMAPAQRRCGGRSLAAYRTEPARNTFPRLPVRDDSVFSWISAFESLTDFDHHLKMLRQQPDWRAHATSDVLALLARKPEVLKLTPTPRARYDVHAGS